MNIHISVLASVVIVALSGCGGGLSPSGVPGSIPGATRFEPLRSPIAPKARGESLLYASSVNNCDVYVFTYPRGRIVQTINVCDLGFGPAFGLCTDKAGNIFMDMGAGFSVFEFAHGGTQPIAQLESGTLLPVGCSIDRKTGDLGVASVTGSLAVYKNASGDPAIYSLSDIEAFYFCTYDDHGNLFAAGEHSNSSFALVELPKGAGALREISVNGTITPGYGLQWDGQHLALGAAQTSSQFVVDRIRVSGRRATVIGTTTLDASANSSVPVEFWIQGKTIIQPQAENGQIGFWNYPAGGEQIRDIGLPGSMLSGVTVSRVHR